MPLRCAGAADGAAGGRDAGAVLILAFLAAVAWAAVLGIILAILVITAA